jgi:hypothetical protein
VQYSVFVSLEFAAFDDLEQLMAVKTLREDTVALPGANHVVFEVGRSLARWPLLERIIQAAQG